MPTMDIVKCFGRSFLFYLNSNSTFTNITIVVK